MQTKQSNIIKPIGDSGIYSAPGLIDLQVNGVNGIDFNDTSLTKEDVLKATKYLLNRGVTTYFPTVITNSDENIISLFGTLADACTTYPLVKETVGGFHLEGPFISPGAGAKGAHDKQFIKPPEWSLFQRYQEAANGNIRLVTLTPEWKETPSFIKKCRKNNVLVSMGHSLADTSQIHDAVKAGLGFSTHLGNGVPPMLKRHPNILWDQLAEDRLVAMLIADGHHLPDNFMKVVMRTKADKVILVSDTTRFAGMSPGEYETFIGGKVVLSKDKRLAMNDNSGLLAGAAKDLLECVETLVAHGLTTLESAWEMASIRVKDLLEKEIDGYSISSDNRVEFKIDGNEIEINRVFKDGEVVCGT